MIISEQDAVWAADEFIEYFSQMTNIEDYLRFVKKEVIKKTTTLDPICDEFLNEDIHPNDMDFKIVRVGKGGLDQKFYTNLLMAVSSHNNEQNIPGRELKWVVYEKNTNHLYGWNNWYAPRQKRRFKTI
jgi:hypothetical protein